MIVNASSAGRLWHTWQINSASLHNIYGNPIVHYDTNGKLINCVFDANGQLVCIVAQMETTTMPLHVLSCSKFELPFQ